MIEIILDYDCFSASMMRVLDVLSTRSPHEIYKYALCTAYEDGTLEIKVTDGSINVTLEVGGVESVETQSSWLMDSRAIKVLNASKPVDEDDLVATVTLNDKGFILDTKSGQFPFETPEVTDWVEHADYEGQYGIKCSLTSLLSGLKEMLPYTDTSAARPALHGVNVKIGEEDFFSLTASDGRKLLAKINDEDGIISECIVYADCLKIALNILKPYLDHESDELIDITIGNTFNISMPGVKLSLRTVHTNYPKIDSILKGVEDAKHTFRVDTAEIIKHIKTINHYKKKEDRALRLSPSQGVLALEQGNAAIETVIECPDFEPLELDINFLQTACNLDEAIEVSLIDKSSPIYFSNDIYEGVIMPIESID